MPKTSKKRKNPKLNPITLKQIIFSNLLLFSGITLLKMEEDSNFYKVFKKIDRKTFIQILIKQIDSETEMLLTYILKLKVKNIKEAIEKVNSYTLSVVQRIFDTAYSDMGMEVLSYLKLEEYIEI
jgi:hypothetical protein